MMSLPDWLPGLMFLLGGLCPWFHVPSGGSLSRGVCLVYYETLHQKRGQYASYGMLYCFHAPREILDPPMCYTLGNAYNE